MITINSIAKLCNDFQVVFISGMPYSGKSTLTNRLVGPDIGIIEVIRIGDIVRKLTDRQSRTFDSSLDKEITKKLKNHITSALKSEKRHVVVDGVRSFDIYRHTISFLKNRNIKYLIMWLEVPEKELMNRFREGTQEKDKGKKYVNIWLSEQNLGTLALKDQLIENYSILILNNNDETIRNTPNQTP